MSKKKAVAGEQPGFLHIDQIAPALHNRNIGNYDDLVESISENGLIQAIVVRPVIDTDKIIAGVTHRIVAGERRYFAYKKLGKHDKTAFPMIKVDVQYPETDSDWIAAQLAENIGRKQIGPYDLAMGLIRLEESPRPDGEKWTKVLIGKKVGLDPTRVANLQRTVRALCPGPLEMFKKVAAGSGETNKFIAAAGIKAENAEELEKAQLAFLTGAGGEKATTDSAEGDTDPDKQAEKIKQENDNPKFVYSAKAFATMLDDAPAGSYLKEIGKFLFGARSKLPPAVYDKIPRGKRPAAEE